MKTKIITSLMALALLFAACGKQSAKKAEVPAVLYQESIKPSDVFTATRNGNHVTIQWILDFSACRTIVIRRDTTGIEKNNQMIAQLPGSSKKYEDNLPDSSAYWYWINVTLPNGSRKSIGPVRVAANLSNTEPTVSVSAEAHLSAHRTENTANIEWGLPNVEYKYIRIKRSTNPSTKIRKSWRGVVLTTKEWQGNFVDDLPDSDADFWYWIEALRTDGGIILQGPIRAEFDLNNAGAAGSSSKSPSTSPTSRGHNRGKRQK